MRLSINDRPVPQPYAAIATVLLLPTLVLLVVAIFIALILAVPGIIVMVVGDARR